MCLYITDACDVWHQTEVRARRQHRCRCCGLAIAVGVVHHRIATLADGRWFTDRAHIDCHELAKWLQLDVCGQELYSLDLSLRGEIREHLAEPAGREALRRWREVLRARRVEGVWPVRRAIEVPP